MDNPRDSVLIVEQGQQRFSMLYYIDFSIVRDLNTQNLRVFCRMGVFRQHQSIIRKEKTRNRTES